MAEQIISASGTQYGMIVNPDGSLKTLMGAGSSINFDSTLNYKQLMDYDGQYQPVYIGLALPGTGSEVAEWMLKKYIYENNLSVAVLFGSGTTNFDKKWSERSGTLAVYS